MGAHLRSFSLIIACLAALPASAQTICFDGHDVRTSSLDVISLAQADLRANSSRIDARCLSLPQPRSLEVFRSRLQQALAQDVASVSRLRDQQAIGQATIGASGAMITSMLLQPAAWNSALTSVHPLVGVAAAGAGPLVAHYLFTERTEEHLLRNPSNAITVLGAYLAEGNALTDDSALERAFGVADLPEVRGNTALAAQAQYAVLQAIRRTFEANLSAVEAERQAVASATPESARARETRIAAARNGFRDQAAAAAQSVRDDLEKGAAGIGAYTALRDRVIRDAGPLSDAFVANHEEMTRLAGKGSLSDREQEEYDRLLRENSEIVAVLAALQGETDALFRASDLTSSNAGRSLSPEHRGMINRWIKVHRDIYRVNNSNGSVRGTTVREDAAKAADYMVRAAQIGTALAKSGLVSPEDAQNIATASVLVSYTGMFVAGIATERYDMSIVAVLNAAGYFLNRGRDPIAESLNQINQNIGVVSQQVAVLDEKIDSLHAFNVRAYKSLTEQIYIHHLVSSEATEEIGTTSGLVLEIGLVELQRQVNHCRDDRLPTNTVTFAAYHMHFSGVLQSCLKGLADVLNSAPDRDRNVAIHFSHWAQDPSPVSRQITRDLDRALYQPARDFFCRSFGLHPTEAGTDSVYKTCFRSTIRPAAFSRAVRALRYPPISRHAAASMLHRLAVRDTAVRDTFLPGNAIGGHYYDARLVIEIGDWIISHAVYYEIESNAGTFQPAASLEAYLRLPHTERMQRRERATRYLATAYRFVDYSIAQQVLLSGVLYLGQMQHVLQSATSTAAEKRLAHDVLRFNPYVQANYSLLLFQEALQVSGDSTAAPCSAFRPRLCFDRFAQLHAVATNTTESELARSAAASAVAEMNLGLERWGYRIIKRGSQLFFTHPTFAPSSDILYLPVPTPETIRTGTVSYPPVIHALLDQHEAIAASLLSRALPRYLASGTDADKLLSEYAGSLVRSAVDLEAPGPPFTAPGPR